MLALYYLVVVFVCFLGTTSGLGAETSGRMEMALAKAPGVKRHLRPGQSWSWAVALAALLPL